MPSDNEKPRLRLVGPGEEMWTADEVAAFLRVSVDCVWRWAREKAGIPHVRIRGTLRFPAGKVKAWVEGQVVQ